MNRWKGLWVVTLLALVACAIGLGTQYRRALRSEAAARTLERDLTFQALATQLGAAAVEALQGSYEDARRTASDFFTGLQANIRDAPQELAPEFNAILVRRDAVITSLSRAEPASSDTLAAMFNRYRLTWNAFRGDEHPASAPPATAPPDSAPPAVPR